MKTAPAPNKPGNLRVSHSAVQTNHTVSAIRESTSIATPTVSIQGFVYLVDLGPGSTCRYHRVSKNKDCSCGAADCEAIEVVRFYLLGGGARAPEQERMPSCPICGSKTYRDRNWDGKYTRQLGWHCNQGGLGHFLEAKARRIQVQLAENPWLLPPAPGYPGVRRDELITWEECELLQSKALLEVGSPSDPEDYIPTL
jgi:hypothetical protein